MHRHIILIALAAVPLLGLAPEAKSVTLVALVRHAEKKGELSDPGLTPEGWKRAQRLAKVFRSARVDALIASDLKRTQETLQPVADEKGLEIKQARRAEDVVQEVKALKAGSFALVAHHSFTLHDILRGLGVPPDEVKAIDVDAYENLLVVAYHPELRARLLHLMY